MSQDGAKQEKAAKAFDWFELLTALLLGFAAIGAAVAGHQNNLWGGLQSEAYSEATTMTTKAANLYSESIAEINLDYAVDLQAKKEILEAMEEEGSYRERKFEIASNLYTRYLSDDAYDGLDLPDDLHEADADDSKKEKFTKSRAIDEEDLIDSVEAELGEKYVDAMLDEANKEFAKADKRFNDGRIANGSSDKFSMIQVIYTISLLFAGLGLVFKTNMRWAFWGAGTFVFVVASIQMMLIPWA